jgi:hypothetical protein
MEVHGSSIESPVSSNIFYLSMAGNSNIVHGIDIQLTAELWSDPCVSVGVGPREKGSRSSKWGRSKTSRCSEEPISGGPGVWTLRCSQTWHNMAKFPSYVSHFFGGEQTASVYINGGITTGITSHCGQVCLIMGSLSDHVDRENSE